jgi:hypothetical protein
MPCNNGACALQPYELCSVHETDKSRVVQLAFEAILRGNSSLAAAL